MFVIAMALLLVAATPAIACEEDPPFGGEQVMALNFGEADEILYGCDRTSWFGTINVSGKTFGMALYPLAAGYVDDETGLYHYSERWRIFTGTFSVKDGALESCHPGMILAEGRDLGTWDTETGYFQSKATVDYVTGDFKSWWGKTVMQDGYATQPVSVAGLEGVPGLQGRLWLEG